MTHVPRPPTHEQVHPAAARYNSKARFVAAVQGGRGRGRGVIVIVVVVVVVVVVLYFHV